MFQRLKQSLKRTRHVFTEGLATLFLGKKTIDAALFDELEMLLLSTDIGVSCTEKIIKQLTAQVARKHLKDSGALYRILRQTLIDLLVPSAVPLIIQKEKTPTVILFVGINGAGKTTTIGKLARQLQLQKKEVLLAAGDTFRAAAVEQLKIWGERNAITVIAQKPGADSAAVIYDALQAAKARNMDVLLADTAGRLHTQQHLLEELKKIKRVIGRLDASAPHEVLLVLDAGIGQNALTQARQFHEALGVTGLVITKMDGTAKGGILFSIAESLKLPIYFIGVGEALEDLQVFKPEAFVDALLEREA